MSDEGFSPSPFEVLGLLAGADRAEVERRAEALASMLRLGLAPPEGDAVALPEGFERTVEEGAEAARVLRDPHQWLREVVLWPERIASNEALAAAADLLEKTAGQPQEPASLVRQLAQEFLAEKVRRTSPTEQPRRQIDRLLAPKNEPKLYFGSLNEQSGGDHGSHHR